MSTTICRTSGQSLRSIRTLYVRFFEQIIMVGFFSYPNVLVNPRIYNAPNFIECISLSPKKKIQQTSNFMRLDLSCSRPVYYYVFAVFTTIFYSKLRPTVEPDYSTLEQTSFFQNSFVQKGTYRD